jgi:hypothetical protein
VMQCHKFEKRSGGRDSTENLLKEGRECSTTDFVW